MRRLLFMVVVVLGAVIVPKYAAPVRAQTTPGSFALTYLDFPPPARIVAARVEANAMAATEPGVVHFGSSFDAENRLDGYFMDSGTLNLDTKGKAHIVSTAYLVSHFATSDLAAAAFTEQHNGWEGQIVTPESGSTTTTASLGTDKFGDQSAPYLYVTTATGAQGQQNYVELLFQRGPYLIEVFQAYLVKDQQPYGTAAQAYLLSIGHKLDAIASGTPLPPAPPKVDFRIMKVRAEKDTGDQPQLSKPAISQAATGTKLRFSIYVVVNSAPASAPVKVDYKLTLGKHTYHQVGKHNLAAQPADYYTYYVYDVKPVLTGTYTFAGKVTIGKVSHQGTASVKVTARHQSAAVSAPSLVASPAHLVVRPESEMRSIVNLLRTASNRI